MAVNGAARYYSSMSRREATREEADRIEGAFDRIFHTTPLPAAGRSAAVWHLINYIEDHLRLAVVSNEDPARLFSEYSLMPFAYLHALATLMKRLGPEASGYERPIFQDDAYLRAMLLIGAAKTYDGVVRGFVQYHKDGGTFLVDPDRNLVEFVPERIDPAYTALDAWMNLVQEGDPGPFPRLLPLYRDEYAWPEPLRRLGAATSRQSLGVVTYRVDYGLAREMAKLFSDPRPAVPIAMPSPWGPGVEVRSFLEAIRARCIYHALSVWAGSHGMKGMGHRSGPLTLTDQQWEQDIWQISGLEPGAVSRLIELYTYGFRTKSPDPALQPLVRRHPGVLTVSPLFTATLDLHRNFLTLFARVEPRAFDSSSAIFANEMTAELMRFIKSRYSYATHGVVLKDAGEVDIVLADPIDRVILVLELRWMLSPADINEVRERRKVCGEKVNQVLRKVASISAAPGFALDRVGLRERPGSPWSVHGIVVLENFAGSRAGERDGVPVVPRRVIEHVLEGAPSLSSAFALLNSYCWLPAEGPHFDFQPMEGELAPLILEYPGIRVPAGPVNYWQTLKQMCRDP